MGNLCSFLQLKIAKVTAELKEWHELATEPAEELKIAQAT